MRRFLMLFLGISLSIGYAFTLSEVDAVRQMRPTQKLLTVLCEKDDLSVSEEVWCRVVEELREVKLPEDVVIQLLNAAEVTNVKN